MVPWGGLGSHGFHSAVLDVWLQQGLAENKQNFT